MRKEGDMEFVAELTVANVGDEDNILRIIKDGQAVKTIRWRHTSIIETAEKVIDYLRQYGIRAAKVMNGGCGWAVEDYLDYKGYKWPLELPYKKS